MNVLKSVYQGSLAGLGLVLAIGLGLGCKQEISAAQTGCASDRDCKGDRICVDKVCEEPPAAQQEPTEAQPTRVKPQVKEGLFARRKLSFYRSKFDAWRAEHGDTCPKDLIELIGGTDEPGVHDDPWGRPYILKCGDSAPDGHPIGVITLGPDGEEGTADDLRSW